MNDKQIRNELIDELSAEIRGMKYRTEEVFGDRVTKITLLKGERAHNQALDDVISILKEKRR